MANALTGLSGAVVGQAQKTADINSGTGIVVIGLACLIIGETIVGRGAMFRGAIAVVAGSILYRLVYALVLYTKVVPVDCLKLVTAWWWPWPSRPLHPAVVGFPDQKAPRWPGERGRSKCWN